jgi:hypothetical protein
MGLRLFLSCHICRLSDYPPLFSPDLPAPVHPPLATVPAPPEGVSNIGFESRHPVGKPSSLVFGGGPAEHQRPTRHFS